MPTPVRFQTRCGEDERFDPLEWPAGRPRQSNDVKASETRANGLIGLSAKPMFGKRASVFCALLLTPPRAGGRITPA
jgi:hypothetical protein